MVPETRAPCTAHDKKPLRSTPSPAEAHTANVILLVKVTSRPVRGEREEELEKEENKKTEIKGKEKKRRLRGGKEDVKRNKVKKNNNKDGRRRSNIFKINPLETRG